MRSPTWTHSAPRSGGYDRQYGEFTGFYEEVNEDVDEDKFVSLFAKATVKGWKGLTLSVLQELILIDMKENDPTTELEYSQENAQLLMQNSTEFDQWLNEVVFDLANFRGGAEGRTVRQAGKVSKE